MPLEQLSRSNSLQPETASKTQTKTQPENSPAFDFDITIVGGGVVGTTLACALKDSGLKVGLIDAQSPARAAARQQVYAVSLLSGRILEGIGVWERILPKITTFRNISLTDSNRAEVMFAPTDLKLDRLGYVAEHTPLLTELQGFLAEAENVSCVSPAQVIGVEYQDDGAIVEIKTEDTTENTDNATQKLRTRLLVAADGSKSRVREAAGIRTRGWKYWQSCITLKVKPEKPHNNIAYERFWPSGPFAILPLTENRCNIVWTAPHEEAKALSELDDDRFLEELHRRYGDRMGRVSIASPRFIFPVKLMQSDRYVRSRLALVGDAAHCCHPVGGQGMNLGIRDAAALAQVLKTAWQQGEDIGNVRVLQRYERWRKWENLVILGFTDFLDRLFSNGWLPLVAARRLGLWILQNLFPLKQVSLRLMTGLLGRTPQLAQR
ncbi:MAG: FAD-dependent hydroxylase [Cyanobacteriota bacterium]|nr:FAD-dependent hydroxylase [Cyanobacteriota bacterium]